MAMTNVCQKSICIHQDCRNNGFMFTIKEVWDRVCSPQNQIFVTPCSCFNHFHVFFCYHFLIPLSIISISLFHQSHISLVLTFSFTFTSLPLSLSISSFLPFHSSFYDFSIYHLFIPLISICFITFCSSLSHFISYFSVALLLFPIFLSCSFALSYFSPICPGFNQFDITSLYHFFHLSFYFAAVPVLLIFLFVFLLLFVLA